MVCGVFPDPGSSPRPLRWQVDSYRAPHPEALTLAFSALSQEAEGQLPGHAQPGPLSPSQIDGNSIFLCVLCLVAQSRPTLCDPTDCSPPGPSVHGILQARVLEWVAMPFSRLNSMSGQQFLLLGYVELSN